MCVSPGSRRWRSLEGETGRPHGSSKVCRTTISSSRTLKCVVTIQEGGMDILVMLEENPDHSPVLAHVNSVPSPLHSSERPSRDIVTLYGAPTPESLALALAAAVESHRS